MNMNELNPEQRRAVETTEGPVLILAGAGSGKTKALTYRVAHLLEQGVNPWNILAITFTNKAAREMQERVEKLVGEAAEEVWISTFHSMCARILRRDIEKLGYQRSFSIYDDDDQSSVLKEVYKITDIDEKVISSKEIKRIISDAKNHLLDPDEWFRTSDRDFRAQKIHDIFYHYEQRLYENNALDFDDLLVKTIELFAEHPPVLESYRNRFRYVHVDEYQDTNFAQYSLVKLLTLQSRNLCVVGDDDQSIYGWRGADIHNILDFQKDYPDAAVIKLEQNYRSTSNILDAANQVIAHNAGRMEKSLWTTEGAGDPITLYSADDERDEATWVCNQIRSLHSKRMNLHDCAILYRSNAQSRVLEDMLMKAGIPYRIYGGLRFYDRKEIKDIAAYLRCIANPADEVSLRRIINTPKRSIGDTTLAVVAQYAQEENLPLFSALQDVPESLPSRAKKSIILFNDLMNNLLMKKEEMKLSDFVNYVVDQSGLRIQYENEKNDLNEAKLENIDEFLGATQEYENSTESATLESYLENLALITDLDQGDEEADRVSLITIHSAKGLEYPVVFIVGLEENIFPSFRSIDDPDRLEEERRLCYVAITRARKKLFLSHAQFRTLYNNINYNKPSRFLEEIPKRLFGMEKPTAKGSGSATLNPSGFPKTSNKMLGLGTGKSVMGIPGVQQGFTTSSTQASTLFNAGDRVRHPKYGLGIVMETSGSGQSATVVIRFDHNGERKFSLASAPIIKVNEI